MKNLKMLVAMLLSTACLSTAANAAPLIQVAISPAPFVDVVIRPVRPGPRHMWVDGYWTVGAFGHRHWVGGFWQAPARRVVVHPIHRTVVHRKIAVVRPAARTVVTRTTHSSRGRRTTTVRR